MNNTLIVGAGPAGLHILSMLNQSGYENLGLAFRKSKKAKKFLNHLNENNFTITLLSAKSSLSNFDHQSRILHYYHGLGTVSDEWENIILCVPSNAYLQALKELQSKSFKKLRSITLISPEFGSSDLVHNYLQSNQIEIVSLSNYFAATKPIDPKNLTKISLKATKKKIYLGSLNHKNFIYSFQKLLDDFFIHSEITQNSLTAESKNITLFVHPPLLFTSLSLDQVFNGALPPRYIYKLFPEGPITMQSISDLRKLWKEISSIQEKFNIPKINLLKFLNDDNYPVMNESIPRHFIDTFPTLSEVLQEYLLYVRYASILIDPFSIPTKQGDYFDFSKVAYSKITIISGSNSIVIPRMPLEDYLKLKLFFFLAKDLCLQTPTINRLTQNFELFLQEWLQRHNKKFNLQELIQQKRKEAALLLANKYSYKQEGFYE